MDKITSQPTEQVGYNFLLKVNGKYLAGLTDSDLDLEAVVRESLTKYDQGITRSVVTGHTCSFSVSGKIAKKTEDSQFVDSDDMMSLSLKKGTEAEFPFIYLRGDLKAYSGTCIISSYKETASDEATAAATFSMSCKVQGELVETSTENE